MLRVWFAAVAGVLLGTVASFGSPTGVSLGINFSPEEPNGAEEGFVTGPAGVAGTAHWNNPAYLDGIGTDLVMDSSGTAVTTSAQVEWFANNSWSSDGRGEDTNNAPPGNDRALMLGYLDTTDDSITEVTVSGLPAEISGGFEMLLYIQGGVIGRGGTYTVTTGAGSVDQDLVATVPFDGTYIEGSEGNFLRFSGLSGSSVTIEALATTPETGTRRAPLNGIEICAPVCLPLPTPVAGRGVIGDQTVGTSLQNPVYGPADDPTPGLYQEWFAVANPGSKAAADNVFNTTAPMVEPFQASHGTTWWSGNQAPFGDLVTYPSEVQPPFNDTDNNNYTVRATGEILIPESGTYRFADGTDDFAYLAIDIDKSGVAGDDPSEVLINDNAWTSVFRDQNNGGGGLGEADISVAAGGEWLAIEFNMGEGGGSDAGVIYWDYNPDAPAGQRLNGGVGFPEIVEDPIDAFDAELLYIPDTHLRAAAKTLISADLVGTATSNEIGLEFEINGDTKAADRLVLNNPDSQVYTTILNVDGLKFHVAATGNIQSGDSFKITNADQILGTVEVVTPMWRFDAATGSLIFGAGVLGDYNNNGQLDSADPDFLIAAIGTNDSRYDVNGDGTVTAADLNDWIKRPDYANSWVGDADLNGEFTSADFVQVFLAGKYETAEKALYSEGDWNGDGLFSSLDFVDAFLDGGYELGPRPAVAASVPEPTGVVLLSLGVLSLLGLRRRK